MIVMLYSDRGYGFAEDVLSEIVALAVLAVVLAAERSCSCLQLVL